MYVSSTLAFRSRLHHCGHFASHCSFTDLPIKSDVDWLVEGYRERKDRIK